MMRRSLISWLAITLPWPALAIDATEARRYALERLVVDNVSSAADPLRAELEVEVQRFLDASERNGRLAPVYFETGIIGSYILHGNPAESLYFLTEALPYVSSATRQRLRNYLAASVRAVDPTTVGFEHCEVGWGPCELSGNRREFYLLPAPPNPDPLRPNIWPPPQVPPETIYIVWRYADLTGDWNFISTTTPPSGERWQRLRNLFQAIPATPDRYGQVVGAIGWLRLLERYGLSNDPSYSAALEKVRAGLTAGANFSGFLQTAFNRFIGSRQHDWAFLPFHFHRDSNAVGIHFAPEIGRFLAEHALEDVRRRVSFNPRENEPGQPKAIEAHWPHWYLYRGDYPPIEKWAGHYGENHMVTPDTPWALFMIHAYVYNEPGEQLVRYLDVPYCVGDLAHLHRLTAAIQAYGSKRWAPVSGSPPPANQPPVVSLTSPANGATFTAPATVTMAATASDPDGSIARVEFLVNGSVAGTDTSAPYSYTVTLSTAGTYTLAARAVDNQGAATTSAAVTITLNAPADPPPGGGTPPPVPNLLTNGGFETGNLDGWYLLWGLTVSPQAAASGAYGLKMMTGGRIDQTFPTVVGRRYYVMARVRIDRELVRPDWGGLRVQITSYDWNELAAETLSAATSPPGTWKRIDLSFVATTEQSRISYESFTGTGRWEASADDFAVSEQPIPPDPGTSPPNQPPTVALTAPSNGATFTAPASVTMTANASDPDGSVARVEFLVNGSVAGTDTSAPYSYTVTLSAAGTYTLAARAVDDRGATATSAAVTITVNAPPPPPPGGGNPPPAPGANLLVNPGFETGNLSGWSGQAQATQADRRSGSWSARFTNGSLEQVVATTPGKTYKLTAWVRIASQSGNDWGGFRIEVQSFDWRQLAFSGWITLESAGSGWTKYALSFTAATSQSRIQIGYFGGPNQQILAYADDLAVFEKTGSGLPPQITPRLTVVNDNGSGAATLNYGFEGDDADGAIVRVNWSFGDGARSQAFAGSRRVAVPGDYTAVFKAADDDGNVVTVNLAWRLRAPSGSPWIRIDQPAEGATVSTSSTIVQGAAGGSIAQILVSTDRDSMAIASGGASWSATLPLKPGWNRILAQVRDTQGRVRTAERRVRFVPSSALSISNFSVTGKLERWEPVEIRFQVNNSAATHPQLPYEANRPRGLEWVDGISVDAYFTRDNWVTSLRRPAFLQQRYQRALKSNEEWMYPQGTPVWTVRFAPPEAGTWKYRIEVREARGTARSAERTLTINPPTDPLNRGPVRVSSRDTRYFEYADGTPFLGGGHGIGIDHFRFSYDMERQLNEIGTGNQQMFRFWIAGQIWGSAWAPWTSRTLSHEGTVAPSGLGLESAYGDGLAALRLDDRNPLMFQGFASSHAALIPGRRYRVRVRWRTEGVTGPRQAGQPYGVVIKFVTWPEPGQTAQFPIVVPHVAGDTPWHLGYGDFTATADLLPNLAVILENTTGGRAFVDEIALHEVLSGGQLGPQLLQTPRFNSHVTYDPRRSAGLDHVFAAANRTGVTFRLVISEKQEFLLNHLGADGLIDPNPGNFNNGPGSPTWRLHEYYWRYLFARYGAYRSLHSWELVNEEAPGPTPHFRLAANLATLAAQDGNPHPATTSTWATFAEEAWRAPFSAPISNVDFHAYVRAGWIEPREELANDSARFFAEYDRASLAMRWGKPATWGEQGINGARSTDDEDPLLARDRNGVWLHKMIWARTGPGGVYPLYWWTDNIFNYRLHRLYGNWNRFMQGIPLTSGRYVDAAAQTSHPDLRVFGQKDTTAGNAHLWIDNRRHTWRAVVDGVSIPPVSGTVTVNLGAPNASYEAIWYDTATGQPVGTTTVTANSGGAVVLNVSNLGTDRAVRLRRR